MEGMIRRSLIPALLPVLLAVLATACSKPDDQPEGEAAVLRAITPAVNELILPPGENVGLPFTVLETDFKFDYNVSSPEFQVSLIEPGGKVPEEFVLKEVQASGDGMYTAVVTDAGTGRHYEKNASIAISLKNEKTGNKSLVRSPEITFKSEDAAPGTVYTGLPVVYVDTEGGAAITSKEDYVHADLSIMGEGGFEGLETVTCSIRGRGNTTWYWPKKPYLIKLDKKESVLGLPKHKRWVLLANFMDRTLMRNLVSMKMASMTSLDWTPRCVPVELVLNGRHQGSYLLIEQVKVDKQRVPVTEMTKEDNSGEELTGGYLLELDFHFDNEVQWVDPHGGNAQWGVSGGVPFGVKYPDPEDITPAQLNYIKQYVYDAAEALYGDGFTDPEKGYAKYLDVDSFIDYWLVFEVMCNHELGNPGSVYFHKDRGGKLIAGPCWDFDWGILSFYTSGGDKNLVNDKAIWYARLFQDPAFKARVKARFEELLPKLETIPDYIDQCEALLKASAGLNFNMWNPAEDASMNNGHIINGDENMSFHDAVVRLKSNYLKHLQIIGEKL